THAPSRRSPGAPRCSTPRGRARGPRCDDPSRPPLRDQVRAPVADHGFAALVSTLRLPGDDAEPRAALRLAPRDDAAAGGDRVPGMDGAEELDVLDAEERAARLGEVLSRETDHGAQHEVPIDHRTRVSVCTWELRNEVEGDRTQHEA